ncbi:hypothetical protein CS369_11360 [Candidatus Symbiopectobacterium sp. 'North America']|uniref:hypothetical protein n=1 Tax=Candidatus Symbiopectobacterium sp. 'North America' TaxID=2794574 RepID=UPI0018CB3BE1|nr:hypothetical protein [Candidatus Symbiopectobacterium sp. 'North America']MBG6245219.1 hypothetical protein [Candidatus Symbiopectobacterium sp. 'North America']
MIFFLADITAAGQQHGIALQLAALVEITVNRNRQAFARRHLLGKQQGCGKGGVEVAQRQQLALLVQLGGIEQQILYAEDFTALQVGQTLCMQRQLG